MTPEMVHSNGMSSSGQSVVGSDGRSGHVQLEVDLAPPPDYEDIAIAQVEDMMREVDRGARKIGIAGALGAALVAVFVAMLWRDAILVAIVAPPSGALIGHVFSRYVFSRHDSWKIEHQRVG